MSAITDPSARGGRPGFATMATILSFDLLGMPLRRPRPAPLALMWSALTHPEKEVQRGRTRGLGTRTTLGVVVILLAAACQAQATPPGSHRSQRAGRLVGRRRQRAGVIGGSAIPRRVAPCRSPQTGKIEWLDPALGYDVTSWPAERLMFEQLLGYDEGTKLVPVARRRDADDLGRTARPIRSSSYSGVNFVNEDGAASCGR